MSMPDHRAGQRELIIFPGALGDLICFIPTMRELIRRAAGAPVDLMARYELANFAVGRMGIARAYSIDRSEISDLFVEGEKHPRAAEFLANFTRVHCFFAADNAHFRRSLEGFAKAAFYPFRPTAEGHIAAAYLRELDVEAPDLPEIRLQVPKTDQAIAEAIMAAHVVRRGEFVLLFPGSGSPGKNWPASAFVDLAKGMSPQIKPLVVLGPAEAELEAEFRRARLDSVNGLDLGAVAGLATVARAFVGNDSGVSHLAGACGACGLVLFGPTDPARWRPFGAVEIIQHLPLTELTVVEVRDRLLRLIEKNSRRYCTAG
jgi:ADP-heptose:LPS heptosyltransferase